MGSQIKKSLRIVLIEDDLDLCSGWEDLFTLIGHEIKTYQKAHDALQNEDILKAADLLQLRQAESIGLRELLESAT